jgi:hypothetical protein
MGQLISFDKAQRDRQASLDAFIQRPQKLRNLVSLRSLALELT